MCRLISHRQQTAGFAQLRILLLALLRPPVDVTELPQRAFDGGRVEPQRNEAALLAQRIAKPERVALQLRPVGAKRLRRHAEHHHAGVLQPFLDLRRDAVAGADLPVIELDAQPVRPQRFGDGAHDCFVLRAVAQEDIVFEIIAHASPVEPRSSHTPRG